VNRESLAKFSRIVACAVYVASLAWKNLQRKAGTLTNLLLGYKSSILRTLFKNELPCLGAVKICLEMRCMEVVNVKVKVFLA
jgi:hypothetical protein